jgi:hypothetical protein
MVRRPHDGNGGAPMPTPRDTPLTTGEDNTCANSKQGNTAAVGTRAAT